MHEIDFDLGYASRLNRMVLMGFAVVFSCLALAQQNERFRQDPEWLTTIQSKRFIPGQICADALGNSYITGTFNTEFVASAPVGQVHESGQGQVSPNDFFLMKLDTLGQPVWTNSAEGQMRVCGVKQDYQDNLIVVGLVFSRTLLLYSKDTLMQALNKPATAGSRGVVLLKFTPKGKLIKHAFYSTGGQEDPQAFSLDDYGNVYVAGHGFYSENRDSRRHALFLKFDADFNLMFDKRNPHLGRSSAFGVCNDSKGNTYITGFYTTQLQFNDAVLQSPDQARQFFLAKFKPDGALVWLKPTFKGLTNQGKQTFGQHVACDAKGRVYLTGRAGSQFFVSRLNSRGKAKWHLQSHGKVASHSSQISIGPRNTVHIVGGFWSGHFPWTNNDTTTMTSNGQQDIMVLSITKKGQLKNAIVVGGPHSDAGHAVAATREGLLIAGYTHSGKTMFKEKEINNRSATMWLGHFTMAR